MLKSRSIAKTEGPDRPASELIDERIGELGDWRGETLARVRALIRIRTHNRQWS